MSQNPIILFDGVCNLCTGAVQFVIKRDPGRVFRFASLQSETGRKLLEQHDLSTTQFDSFILLDKDHLYTRSTAALRVAKRLKGGWPLLYAFIIIPPFIRNAVYNWIARNRYKWFGKKEECWVPTAELKELFLG